MIPDVGSESTKCRRKRRVTIEITCRQRSAIMMDAWPPEPVERVLDGPATPHGPAFPESQRSRMRGKVYRGPFGEIGLPIQHLFNRLRHAGRKLKVNNQQLTTVRGSRLSSFLELEDDFLRLLNPRTLKPLTFRSMRTDIRRGSAFAIERPRFDRWAFKVRMTVTLSAVEGLTEKHIYQLFELAGRRVGLGSWSPIQNGPFGRFEVVNMDVIV